MSVNFVGDVVFSTYKHDHECDEIKKLMEPELSEPYSRFTFKYFCQGWPELTFIARIGDEMIGAVVGYHEKHKSGAFRGCIAMLAVKPEHRHRKLGTILSRLCLDKMQEVGCDYCMLETEHFNKASLGLYRSLGFIKVKRLRHYYMNGADAFRLKRLFKLEQPLQLGKIPDCDDAPPNSPEIQTTNGCKKGAGGC